jgi:hypothetical protein
MIHIKLMKIFNHMVEKKVTSQCNKRKSSYILRKEETFLKNLQIPLPA